MYYGITFHGRIVTAISAAAHYRDKGTTCYDRPVASLAIEREDDGQDFIYVVYGVETNKYFRRRGYMTTLFRHAFKRIPWGSEVVLQVNKTNYNAIYLYEKMGFKITERRSEHVMVILDSAYEMKYQWKA